MGCVWLEIRLLDAQRQQACSRFRLDTLDQVIRALDVDIFSVWPAVPAHLAEDRLESWRNEFRLGELVSVSASEGGALFWIAPPLSRSLLAWNVHETRLQRLMFWLDERPAHGTERLDTARRRLPGGCLSLVLEGPHRLGESRPFIEYYMELWARYILVAERPRRLDQPQPEDSGRSYSRRSTATGSILETPRLGR